MRSSGYQSELLFTVKIKEEYCVDDFDPETSLKCETTKEVDQQLGDTTILMLYNSQRFDQEEYSSEEPVVSEALVEYLEIPEHNSRHIYEIHETELSFDNNIYMSISGITE